MKDMKKQMSSLKAWLILSGLLVVLPIITLGYSKWWSIVYNWLF